MGDPSLIALFSGTGVIQWWRSRQQEPGPEFVALVEEILAEATEGVDGPKR